MTFFEIILAEFVHHRMKQELEQILRTWQQESEAATVRMNGQ